jgi:hypothetical protein
MRQLAVTVLNGSGIAILLRYGVAMVFGKQGFKAARSL